VTWLDLPRDVSARTVVLLVLAALVAGWVDVEVLIVRLGWDVAHGR
jgi:hypothetical protein